MAVREKALGEAALKAGALDGERTGGDRADAGTEDAGKLDAATAGEVGVAGTTSDLCEVADAAADADGALDRDTIFFALSNRRRRYAIHYLKQHDGPVRFRDLVEQVAAWEHDCPPEEVTRNQRKAVYTALRQTHVPMLRAAGLVRCDGGLDNITLSASADDLDVYLEVVPRGGLSWAEFYLGLSGVSLAVLAAVRAGAVPFVDVPSLAFAALVGVAFLVSAVVHVYATRKGRLGRFDGAPVP